MSHGAYLFIAGVIIFILVIIISVFADAKRKRFVSAKKDKIILFLSLLLREINASSEKASEKIDGCLIDLQEIQKALRLKNFHNLADYVNKIIYRIYTTKIDNDFPIKLTEIVQTVTKEIDKASTTN